MNNNPVVYYLWQPEFVSQSVQHQLRTDTPPTVQNITTSIFRHSVKYNDYFADKFNRKFYMDIVYTTDNKEVLYADLYLDTKALSVVLKLDEEEGSLLCHILSLYNLI